jgi:hypothetical protein
MGDVLDMTATSAAWGTTPPVEAVELIINALSEIPIDLETVVGKRVYLAYLAARSTRQLDPTVEAKIGQPSAQLDLAPPQQRAVEMSRAEMRAQLREGVEFLRQSVASYSPNSPARGALEGTLARSRATLGIRPSGQLVCLPSLDGEAPVYGADPANQVTAPAEKARVGSRAEFARMLAAARKEQ